MGVRFGVFVPQGWRLDLVEIADPVEKYEAMTRVARAADALPAFDSIWLFDHFHTVPRPTQEAVFEAWTTTAALTRDTRRVHVGQMVTCIGYRNPALLAKMASTVDVMSHGRLYCGIGAGWYEHEWRAFGYGFPDTRERMRGLREATGIMVRMWTEDAPVFRGEHYSIEGPINQPKSVRKPHPSLWIGGGGEQVTLKLVARYGDACNIGGDPATIRHKLEVLRGHCEAVGRDYEQIIRSSNLTALVLQPGEDADQALERVCQPMGVSPDEVRQIVLVGTLEQIRQQVQAKVDAGINYVILNFVRIAYDHEPLHRFAAEVIPQIG
jgi:F420-dependent oxidoreductase-like protein